MFVFQVYFDENHTIDNIYSKDFFYEVFHEMLSPKSGMFMFNDSETLAWFTSNVSLLLHIVQFRTNKTQKSLDYPLMEKRNR